MINKRLAILGSTGSIGLNVLQVIDTHPDIFKIVSLAAAHSVETLARQTIRYKPKVIAVLNESTANTLKTLLPSNLSNRVVYGPSGYIEATIASNPDLVLNATIGIAGLIPTYAAINNGLTIALANKEILVAAGEILINKATLTGSTILPIDSEHSAIFQILINNKNQNVKRYLLTASGGPFRKKNIKKNEKINISQAIKHPTWNMGPKISINSATMMNKGMEIIETRWLFNQPLEKIHIIIHPQSIIHSIIEYIDGSMIAQLGLPDMRLPITFALTYPKRIAWKIPYLDLTKIEPLTFKLLDNKRFPAINLAYQVSQVGGTTPAVFNGANEIAVEEFLAGHLSFTKIIQCVETVIEKFPGSPATSIENILDADRWARRQAKSWISKINK